MNSRYPKVWHTEDQIVAQIERVKRASQRSLEKSKLLEEKVKEKFGKCEELRFELMKPLSPMQRESLESKLRSAEMAAGKAKDAADEKARSYHRAINSTLPRLGEILAAFRTGTFKEIVGEYRAVSVR